VSNARPVSTITHAAAQKVIAAAVAEADAIDVPVNIAVGDPGGNLVAFLRMDGAPLLSAGIAKDKAYTVSAFKGMPTAGWYGAIADEPALLHGIVKTDRFIIFGGGLPVVDSDGVVIGSVGVSGGSAEQDEQIAAAGAAGILG
jgi:glc operon protein GlcG